MDRSQRSQSFHSPRGGAESGGDATSGGTSASSGWFSAAVNLALLPGRLLLKAGHAVVGGGALPQVEDEETARAAEKAGEIDKKIDVGVSSAISPIAVCTEARDDTPLRVSSSVEFWLVQLEAIYRKRNPYKLHKVPALLQKYAGKEAFLYRKVCHQYDLDPLQFYADASAWAFQVDGGPTDDITETEEISDPQTTMMPDVAMPPKQLDASVLQREIDAAVAAAVDEALAAKEVATSPTQSRVGTRSPPLSSCGEASPAAAASTSPASMEAPSTSATRAEACAARRSQQTPTMCAAVTTPLETVESPGLQVNNVTAPSATSAPMAQSPPSVVPAMHAPTSVAAAENASSASTTQTEHAATLTPLLAMGPPRTVVPEADRAIPVPARVVPAVAPVVPPLDLRHQALASRQGSVESLASQRTAGGLSVETVSARGRAHMRGGTPRPKQLLIAFRDALLQGFGSLEVAFKKIDVFPNAKVTLTELQQFLLTTYRFDDHGVTAKVIFNALDVTGRRYLVLSDFLSLRWEGMEREALTPPRSGVSTPPLPSPAQAEVVANATARLTEYALGTCNGGGTPRQHAIQRMLSSGNHASMAGNDVAISVGSHKRKADAVPLQQSDQDGARAKVPRRGDNSQPREPWKWAVNR